MPQCARAQKPRAPENGLLSGSKAAAANAPAAATPRCRNSADLIRLIQTARENHKIEGVSLIGGEPLLQAEGLSEIAVWCQSEGLSVLVFTGYTYQTLQTSEDKSVQLLLKHTDILVDGPFLQELYDEKRTWVGSQNQHVIFLTDRYTPGVEYEYSDRTMELLISDKDILINGWPF